MDKCYHMLVMAGITILALLIFRKRNVAFWIIFLSLPTLLELVQLLIPRCTFELLDIPFNYLGVFIVYIPVALWKLIFDSKKRR